MTAGAVSAVHFRETSGQCTQKARAALCLSQPVLRAARVLIDTITPKLFLSQSGEQMNSRLKGSIDEPVLRGDIGLIKRGLSCLLGRHCVQPLPGQKADSQPRHGGLGALRQVCDPQLRTPPPGLPLRTRSLRCVSESTGCHALI